MEYEGGFDAIVGNPPYVFGRDWKALKIPDYCKKYFRQRYTASPYQLDMFSLFMERAISMTKSEGAIGFKSAGGIGVVHLAGNQSDIVFSV